MVRIIRQSVRLGVGLKEELQITKITVTRWAPISCLLTAMVLLENYLPHFFSSVYFHAERFCKEVEEIRMSHVLFLMTFDC